VHLITLFPGGRFWKEMKAHPHVAVNSLFEASPEGRLSRAGMYAVAPLRLFGRLRRIDPDVVYSALYLTNVVAWLATRWGWADRLVWSIRTAYTDGSPAHMALVHACRMMSASLPLIVSNSEAGKQFHSEMGFRPRRWRVLPNGIDVERFRPNRDHRERVRSEWGVEEGVPLIGLVGRLNGFKDHPTFLRAIARVVQRFPAARFVCVGRAPRDYLHRLQRLAADLGISEHVRWAGERSDMVAVYNALDLLCSSSRVEGFSNVIVEAMACETACVVTDVGDSASIVGSSGQVVPPEDPAALADAIIAYIEERRDEGGPARRKRAETFFSISRLAADLEDIFEEVENA
jgi:glycosyltransferase involved in cell wall biosynthesis